MLTTRTADTALVVQLFRDAGSDIPLHLVHAAHEGVMAVRQAEHLLPQLGDGVGLMRDGALLCLLLLRCLVLLGLEGPSPFSAP